MIVQAQIINDWRKATDRSDNETIAVAILGINPLQEHTRVFYILRIGTRSTFVEKIHSVNKQSITRFSQSPENPIIGLFTEQNLIFLDQRTLETKTTTTGT